MRWVQERIEVDIARRMATAATAAAAEKEEEEEAARRATVDKRWRGIERQRLRASRGGGGSVERKRGGGVEVTASWRTRDHCGGGVVEGDCDGPRRRRHGIWRR